MKKIAVILTIGIVSLSSCQNPESVKNENVYKESIHFKHYDVYPAVTPNRYISFRIVEFTPEGNPNYVCIVTAGNYGSGISCIPKENKNEN